jgi:hypothetical protein
LRPENDGFEPSSSASLISCGRAADDLAERVLNSLMDGQYDALDLRSWMALAVRADKWAL